MAARLAQIEASLAASGDKNQLTRANDLDADSTVVYAYDNGGNILSRTIYAYTTGELGAVQDTVSYGYNDTGWKDLLTSYDGQTITYDAIGNPLTYRDGMTMTWRYGRQLATLNKEGLSATFIYNSEGYRISKTVNGNTTEFFLGADGTILAEKKNGVTIKYLFDASGTRIGMEVGGMCYFYDFNAQGDVVALRSSGAIVATYKYDAWGNVISATNSTVANFNSFLYRGYYYDAETGLYYLNSRYYDPVVGRFVNADDIDVLEIDQDHLSENNLFAYCLNDPINMTDDTGHIAWWIGAAIGGALFDTAAYLIGCAVTGKKATWAGVGKAALVGAVTGVTFGAIGKGVKAASGAIKATKMAQKGIGVLQKASNAALKAAQRIGKFSVSSKHLANAGGRWVKFATNSKSQVNRWVKEALKSKKATFYPNGSKNGSYYLITNLGRKIGTKGQTSIKVVFDSSGNIWTAMPV